MEGEGGVWEDVLDSSEDLRQENNGTGKLVVVLES